MLLTLAESVMTLKVLVFKNLMKGETYVVLQSSLLHEHSS
jgi:hypothetical protein